MPKGDEKEVKIVFDDFQDIEDDIEKIQTKPGMYIGYHGPKAAEHLSHEIINNSIDELVSPKSVGSHIWIEYDIDTDTLTVEDDGRGFQSEDTLRKACTKIQAGTKMTREQSGNSAGENGVGLTAVNALSSLFSIRSRNGDSDIYLEFEEGHEKRHKTTKLKDKSVHGTITKFCPSKKYLGRNAKLPYKDVIAWLEKLTNLMSAKNMVIEMKVYRNNRVVEKKKFKKGSLENLIALQNPKFHDNQRTKIVSFEANKKLKETQPNGKVLDRTLDLSVAFGYAEIDVDTFMISFCNFVETIDGGSHLDGVMDGLRQYLVAETKKSLSEREKKKLDIRWADVLPDLAICVSLDTDMQMYFASQAKHKVANEELHDPIKEMTISALQKFFTKNPEVLKQITNVIKENAKIRIEAQDVKASVVKGKTTRHEEFLMDKFVGANNSDRQYKELFIVEGDSAKGGVRTARDPDTQAVFCVRGNGLNAIKNDEKTIWKNSEWATLAKILGCGTGKDFDINKCRYNKIILAADADIDGFHITSLQCAFFMRAFIELVKAGMVYRSVPPLYRIRDGKKTMLVKNNGEITKIAYDKINKHVTISTLTRVPGKKKPIRTSLSKKELLQFIEDTSEYMEVLDDGAFYHRANKLMVEHIIAYIRMNFMKSDDDIEAGLKRALKPANLVKFNDDIQMKFPEIMIRPEGIVTGTVDYKNQSFVLNKNTIEMYEDLFPVYTKYGLVLYVEEDTAPGREMSISEVLALMSAYFPKKEQRFKGLGESTPDEIKTFMDPNTRTLIRLTVDDVDRDYDIFEMLHGSGQKNESRRKKMMSEYVLRREDLDN